MFTFVEYGLLMSGTLGLSVRQLYVLLLQGESLKAKALRTIIFLGGIAGGTIVTSLQL